MGLFQRFSGLFRRLWDFVSPSSWGYKVAKNQLGETSEQIVERHELAEDAYEKSKKNKSFLSKEQFEKVAGAGITTGIGLASGAPIGSLFGFFAGVESFKGDHKETIKLLAERGVPGFVYKKLDNGMEVYASAADVVLGEGEGEAYTEGGKRRHRLGHRGRSRQTHSNARMLNAVKDQALSEAIAQVEGLTKEEYQGEITGVLQEMDQMYARAYDPESSQRKLAMQAFAGREGLDGLNEKNVVDADFAAIAPEFYPKL